MKTPEQTLKALADGKIYLVGADNYPTKEYLMDAHDHLANIKQGLEILKEMKKRGDIDHYDFKDGFFIRKPTPKEFEEQHMQSYSSECMRCEGEGLICEDGKAYKIKCNVCDGKGVISA